MTTRARRSRFIDQHHLDRIAAEAPWFDKACGSAPAFRAVEQQLGGRCVPVPPWVRPRDRQEGYDADADRTGLLGYACWTDIDSWE